MAVNCSEEVNKPRGRAGPITREREAIEETHSSYFLNGLLYRDLSCTVASTDRAILPTRRLDPPFLKNSALLPPAP
jgi:hypothetical protein